MNRNRSVTLSASSIGGQAESLLRQVNELFDRFQSCREELSDSVASMTAMREERLQMDTEMRQQRLQMDKEKYDVYLERQSKAVQELREMTVRVKGLVRPVRELLRTAAFALAAEGRDLLQVERKFDQGVHDLPSVQDQRDGYTAGLLTELHAALAPIRGAAIRHHLATKHPDENSVRDEASTGGIEMQRDGETAIQQHRIRTNRISPQRDGTDDIRSVKKFIRAIYEELVKKGRPKGMYEMIAGRLHDQPRPPDAAWQHLTWDAAIGRREYKQAVRTWIYKAIREED